MNFAWPTAAACFHFSYFVLVALWTSVWRIPHIFWPFPCLLSWPGPAGCWPDEYTSTAYPAFTDLSDPPHRF